MPLGAGVTLFSGYDAPAGGGQGDASGSYGGRCLQILAGEALNVGDGVYLSSAGHVSKGVAANNALFIGVVVGGEASRARVYPEIKIGAPAALAAEDWVLVCFSGKVRAVADAAIVAGAALAFGATAGRLDDTLTDATTVVGTRFGKALMAAAGAASEFDALISLM